MGAINQLTLYYGTDGEQVFAATPSLFVFVRDCTKGFKESNFNVARSLLDFFTTVFSVHATLEKSPNAFLYSAAIRLAVEKIGDKKLAVSSASCLFSISKVKDPQRIMTLAVKYIEGIKSPLVHEALLDWFKAFCVNFGAAVLSKCIQDILTWVLKVNHFVTYDYVFVATNVYYSEHPYFVFPEFSRNVMTKT